MSLNEFPQSLATWNVGLAEGILVVQINIIDETVINDQRVRDTSI
jgi:hypothetical protein